MYGVSLCTPFSFRYPCPFRNFWFRLSFKNLRSFIFFTFCPPSQVISYFFRLRKFLLKASPKAMSHLRYWLHHFATFSPIRLLSSLLRLMSLFRPDLQFRQLSAGKHQEMNKLQLRLKCRLFCPQNDKRISKTKLLWSLLFSRNFKIFPLLIKQIFFLS